MNYIVYTKEMERRNLIESPSSVLLLAEAKRCQENLIRLRHYTEYDREILRRFGIDFDKLYEGFEFEKRRNVLSALEKAWDKDEALEELGNAYLTKKGMLELVVEPRTMLVIDHYEKKGMKEWKRK